MKKQFLILSLFCTFILQSQIKNNHSIKISNHKNYKFNFKQIIIPTVLIGYGVIGLESDALKGIDLNIRNEVIDDIDKKITIDDFLQFKETFKTSHNINKSLVYAISTRLRPKLIDRKSVV